MLSPARAANSSWDNALSERSLRKFVAITSFKSIQRHRQDRIDRARNDRSYSCDRCYVGQVSAAPPRPLTPCARGASRKDGLMPSVPYCGVARFHVGELANSEELPEEPANLMCSTPKIDDLYRTEARRIFGFARRQGRRPDEASDLVQETFLRFVQSIAAITLNKPEAYLRQIAANILRDRAKVARRRAYDRHIPIDKNAIGNVHFETQLEARDILSRVEAAMQQLRPRTREVFMARRVDGLSYAEISEQTGLSFKIIEKEMARAIAHLQQLFGRG